MSIEIEIRFQADGPVSLYVDGRNVAFINPEPGTTFKTTVEPAPKPIHFPTPDEVIADPKGTGFCPSCGSHDYWYPSTTYAWEPGADLTDPWCGKCGYNPHEAKA